MKLGISILVCVLIMSAFSLKIKQYSTGSGSMDGIRQFVDQGFGQVEAMSEYNYRNFNSLFECLDNCVSPTAYAQCVYY